MASTHESLSFICSSYFLYILRAVGYPQLIGPNNPGQGCLENPAVGHILSLSERGPKRQNTALAGRNILGCHPVTRVHPDEVRVRLPLANTFKCSYAAQACEKGEHCP